MSTPTPFLPSSKSAKAENVSPATKIESLVSTSQVPKSTTDALEVYTILFSSIVKKMRSIGLKTKEPPENWNDIFEEWFCENGSLLCSLCKTCAVLLDPADEVTASAALRTAVNLDASIALKQATVNRIKADIGKLKKSSADLKGERSKMVKMQTVLASKLNYYSKEVEDELLIDELERISLEDTLNTIDQFQDTNKYNALNAKPLITEALLNERMEHLKNLRAKHQDALSSASKAIYGIRASQRSAAAIRDVMRVNLEQLNNRKQDLKEVCIKVEKLSEIVNSFSLRN